MDSPRDSFDRGVPFADPAVADLERTMIARADLPTGTCGAGGARVCSRGGCCARRRRRNVLNPRIQCVLTQ